MSGLDQVRGALDTGMDAVQARKQAHFEAFSGQRRNTEDLSAICDAVYIVRPSYKQAEDLYATWAYAPVPADRARAYILSEMTVDEALTVWEPRFAAADPQAAAALEMLVALRAPEGALLHAGRP